ncbi:MAG: argininosuccinate synthase [Phycisphaerales bacterium]
MKVVLAYSGGLDTSAIVPWLIENYNCEVVAFVGDVGQGDAELAGVEEKAIASGASSCHIVDLKHEFLEEFVFPTMAAGAVYEGKYLLGTSMARPILARAQAQLALEVGADALCHGCTGKGNDQVRFESAFASIAPHLPVIAPWRIWDMRSREQLLNYLQERGVPCSASLTKIYSRDANLWHVSHEGGALEDPWNAPPDDMWLLTANPEDAPSTPETVTIGFERGRPRSLNDQPMDPVALVATLNAIGGRHGVGRIDIVENRLVGMKSRGCYETPGGAILVEGLRALEGLVLDRETLRLRERIGHQFADLVYDGRWFTPLREALQASVESIASRLTGEVELKLYKGQAVVTRRKSPHSLYSDQFATFGEDEVYNQAHAEGFIRLYSLPQRISAMQRLTHAEAL